MSSFVSLILTCPYSRSFLNPGGYLEVVDIVYPLHCDDGTLPEDSALLKWSNIMLDNMEKIQRPIASAKEYPEQLAELGFTDIKKTICKWPTNGWPKDAKHKEMGGWPLIK
jgi:hypothetical protein